MGDTRESSSRAEKERVEDLLERLTLHEEEDGEFVWEEEVHEPMAATKWLAISDVHTTRGFSPTAFYSDMRSAWNPTKEVVWRRIDDTCLQSNLDVWGIGTRP